MKLSTFTAGLVVSMAANFAAATVVPDAIVRTDTTVHRQENAILHMAYPSANQVTQDPQGSFFETSGGYALDEKFNYTDSDGVAESFTLRFNLDSNGSVQSITELTRSEWWPTFGTGNLLLVAAKSAAQSDIDSARQANRPAPALAMLILKANDIRELIVLSINAQR